MKKNILLTFVFGVLMLFITAENGFAQCKAVSGKEVTGTYRLYYTGIYKGNYSEIKVSALGSNNLKVGFYLIYPYTYGGSGKEKDITVNLGTAIGEADINGDTAVYLQNDNDTTCKITIKFARPGQIKVTQEEENAGCGFGLNVSAQGTYKKVSGRKPVIKEIDY